MGEMQSQELPEKETKGDAIAAEEENTKKDNNDENGDGTIVLKVFMHCEACARKVAKSLKGFPGVEDVMADSIEGIVRVKGKDANPVEVQERVQEKSRRKVELIAPLPKPITPPVDDEKKDEDKERSAPVTILLNIQMHYEACARVIRKKLLKINGVESARTDLLNNQVVVTGEFDPNELVKQVYKRTKKIATVAEPPREDGEQKSVNGGEEEKKDGENADMSIISKENKEEEKKQQDDVKKNQIWPTIRHYNNYTDHYYQRHHQFAAPYAYPPPPLQIFSDENPNACFIM